MQSLLFSNNTLTLFVHHFVGGIGSLNGAQDSWQGLITRPMFKFVIKRQEQFILTIDIAVKEPCFCRHIFVSVKKLFMSRIHLLLPDSSQPNSTQLNSDKMSNSLLSRVIHTFIGEVMVVTQPSPNKVSAEQ